MKVQRIRTGPGRYNYLLIDDDYLPVYFVSRYMKYLESTGKTEHSRLTYCNGLKYLYEFLSEKGLHIQNVGLKELSDYVLWLYYGFDPSKVIEMNETYSKRSAKTVNLYITIAVSYIEYLYRAEHIAEDHMQFIFEKINGSHRKYKDFLYHITKNRMQKRNLLIQKVPRERTKRLTMDECQQVISAATNIRDEFLLRLLLESGLRIGEALGLYHEDMAQISTGDYILYVKDRGFSVNDATHKTGSREVYIGQSLIDLYDDYCFSLECSIGITTDYVFVKLCGEHAGEPLERPNVYSLFRELKRKTGIDIHPHLFRSTYGSIAYNSTKNIEFVRESMGHKSVQTTIDSYLYPSEEEMIEEWKKVQKALEGETCDE